MPDRLVACKASTDLIVAHPLVPRDGSIVRTTSPFLLQDLSDARSFWTVMFPQVTSITSSGGLTSEGPSPSERGRLFGTFVASSASDRSASSSITAPPKSSRVPLALPGQNFDFWLSRKEGGSRPDFFYKLFEPQADLGEEVPREAQDRAASTAKELIILWAKHEEPVELKLRTSNFVARYGARAIDLFGEKLLESSISGDQMSDLLHTVVTASEEEGISGITTLLLRLLKAERSSWRYAAVDALARSMEPVAVWALKARLAFESNQTVRAAIQTALR
jgi:hypothetical protein